MIPAELRAAVPVWRARGVYAALRSPGVASALLEQPDPGAIVFTTAALYDLALKPYEEFAVVLAARVLVRVRLR